MIYESAGKGGESKEDIHLEITAPDSVSPGQTFSYRFFIKNQGNKTLKNAQILISLSPHLEYLTSYGSAGKLGYLGKETEQQVTHAVIGDLGTLTPQGTKGSTYEGIITVKVKSGLQQGDKIVSSACFKANLPNIFYPGINCKTEEDKQNRYQDKLAFQAKLVDSYWDTQIFDGAFHVWLASLGLPTKKNYLVSDEFDAGDYHIAFSHSGGTQTLYQKIKKGVVTCDYAIFMSPALLTQEGIEELVDGNRIRKKAFVFEHENDILYILHVFFFREAVIPCRGFEELPPAPVLDTSFHSPYPLNIVYELGMRLIAFQTFEFSRYHILYSDYLLCTQVDILSLMLDELNNAKIGLSELPLTDSYYVGGSSRSEQKMFSLSDSLVNINLFELNPIMRLDPTWVHTQLIKNPEKRFLEYKFPFDGSYEGLERDITYEKCSDFYVDLGYKEPEKCDEWGCSIGGSDGSGIGIQVAHDPNAKYGPGRYIKAGETADYTVEFENEGEGTAYDVYVTDVLEDTFDDTTLSITPMYSTADKSIISPVGTYDSLTRMICWQVGEVGPKAGGYANISVKTKSDLEKGTIISNYATVYFPSVPEKTLTNSVVSKIGEYLPPDKPEFHSPFSGSKFKDNNVSLNWMGSDPNDDIVHYDLYFGSSAMPPLIQENMPGAEYYLEDLQSDSTYYWKVVARNTLDLTNESEVWNFTVSSSTNHLTAEYTWKPGYPGRATGAYPFPVEFIPDVTGEGEIVCNWTFGDGETYLNRPVENVTHIYSGPLETALLYNVTLNVTSGLETAGIQHQCVNIGLPVVADFEYALKTVVEPYLVEFNDKSTGSSIDKREWRLPGGEPGIVFDDPNPQVLYRSPGIYTVTLITNSTLYNSGDTIVNNQVDVTADPLPHADFSMIPDRGIIPASITFDGSKSTGSEPMTYRWNFGEAKKQGESDSIVVTSHRYDAPGTYYPTLNVTNTFGKDIAEGTIQIGSPIIPDFSFTYETNPQSGFHQVNFTDTSTGDRDTWVWLFGDGSESSGQKVSHLYATAGTYDVELNVSSSYYGTSVSINKTVVIDKKPIARFSASPIQGETPLTVEFSDLSVSAGEPITEWLWNFGDLQISNNQNPVHIYLNPGKYDVTLTVSNIYGSSTSPAASIYPYERLVSKFSAVPNSGIKPLTVSFIDESLGYPDRWEWEFGDGSGFTGKNPPNHVYPATGQYVVNLTVYKDKYLTDDSWEESRGTESVIIDRTSRTVTVTEATPPEVRFIAKVPVTGIVPFTVSFEDKTEDTTGQGLGPVEWLWEFGDGAMSTIQNSTHTYEKPGMYTVTLNVKTAAGISRKAIPILVVVQKAGDSLLASDTGENEDIFIIKSWE